MHHNYQFVRGWQTCAHALTVNPQLPLHSQSMVQQILHCSFIDYIIDTYSCLISKYLHGVFIIMNVYCLCSESVSVSVWMHSRIRKRNVLQLAVDYKTKIAPLTFISIMQICSNIPGLFQDIIQRNVYPGQCVVVQSNPINKPLAL